jgi:hypothetical protein
VFCAVTIPPADLHSLSLYCYAVCGRMCMSSVRVWCSCLLVICLCVYCVIIQTQRTRISGRNSNGTKNRGGPPEDGREKSPKQVGILYLETRFYYFIGFKC